MARASVILDSEGNGRKNSHSSSSSSSTTGGRRRRTQIICAMAVAAVAWAVRRKQQGASLINPPFCAWRFVGNHDAWNVAFPDMRSLYHVMQMNMDPGDEFKLVAESFPYARYVSYQTYDLKTLMSLQSLRDVDIVPDGT